MDKCKAVLYIGDDYGDNHATMRCQLEEGHEGPHEELWNKEARRGANNCKVTWEGSDK